MIDQTLPLFAVLAMLVVLAEWLERTTPLRHLGSAMIVILLGTAVSNLGLIPPASQPIAAYDAVFGHLAPIGIFLLLLGVDLGRVLRSGGSVLGLFMLGALGTIAGAFVGFHVVGGEEAFGASAHAVAGMFVGTYTGGSANFNAVALQYDVARDGLVYAGAVAVDNILTAVWMTVTLGVPRLVRGRTAVRNQAGTDVSADALPAERDTIDVVGLALLGALAFASWWGARVLEEHAGIPRMLALTSIALVLAQVRAVREITGSRVLGLFCVMLFLAVVGCACDLRALAEVGGLAATIALFATITIVVHGLVLAGGARIVRADPDAVAVASQANVGGGTTALALARSLGRGDLALPAILAGSCGTALGTFLGLGIASFLGGGS